MAPRAKPDLTESERGAFNNLVLLCANCHTMVDKAPEAYPDVLILKWKRDHARKLAALFGVEEYESRAIARLAIEPFLTEQA